MNRRVLAIGILMIGVGLFFAIVPISFLCNCHGYLVPFFLQYMTTQSIIADFLLASGVGVCYLSKSKF